MWHVQDAAVLNKLEREKRRGGGAFNTIQNTGQLFFVAPFGARRSSPLRIWGEKHRDTLTDKTSGGPLHERGCDLACTPISAVVLVTLCFWTFQLFFNFTYHLTACDENEHSVFCVSGQEGVFDQLETSYCKLKLTEMPTKEVEVSNGTLSFNKILSEMTTAGIDNT